MYRAENEEYQSKVGIHWATEQVRDLIDHNTRGVHLYTLNRSNATRQIYDSLGVTTTRGLMDFALIHANDRSCRA